MADRQPLFSMVDHQPPFCMADRQPLFSMVDHQFPPSRRQGV